MPQTEDRKRFLETFSKVWAVSEEEVELRLRTIAPDMKPPKIGFWRSSEGGIQAVTINWYIYGAIVGPESFKPQWEPWYQRKLTDGVYLWHGYK